MVMLAEIEDKLPTLTGALLLGVVAATIVTILAGRRLWLGLLAMPVVAWWNWSLISELIEPGFGNLIVAEMGRSWVVGQFAAFNAPFLVGGMLAWKWNASQRRRMRRLSGLCPGCGYDRESLADIAPCPECGVPTKCSSQESAA
jgi:hypothetical protein